MRNLLEDLNSIEEEMTYIERWSNPSEIFRIALERLREKFKEQIKEWSDEIINTPVGEYLKEKGFGRIQKVREVQSGDIIAHITNRYKALIIKINSLVKTGGKYYSTGHTTRWLGGGEVETEVKYCTTPIRQSVEMQYFNFYLKRPYFGIPNNAIMPSGYAVTIWNFEPSTENSDIEYYRLGDGKLTCYINHCLCHEKTDVQLEKLLETKYYYKEENESTK